MLYHAWIQGCVFVCYICFFLKMFSHNFNSFFVSFHVVMSDVQDGIDLFLGFYAVIVRSKFTLNSHNKQTFLLGNTSFPCSRYCLEIGSSIGWKPRFWPFWLDRAMMVLVHCYLCEHIVLKNIFGVRLSAVLMVILLLRVSNCFHGVFVFLFLLFWVMCILNV
jgi:hypothetical protein